VPLHRRFSFGSATVVCPKEGVDGVEAEDVDGQEPIGHVRRTKTDVDAGLL
jgi:hypothetical protein